MVKNLRQLRMSKGISQEKLAELVGVSQQAINRYENHKFEPDISTLILLADHFNTTVDYLIGHAPTDGAEELELDKEEWELLRNYRGLTRKEKDSILLVMKNYLEK